MIAEYDPETDGFCITRDGETINIDPNEMRILMETGQFAIAKRFEMTGRITV